MVKIKSSTIPNVFGVFGYFSVVIQWVWSVVLYAPYFTNSQAADLFIPEKSSQPITTVASTEPTPTIVIVSVITISAVMMLLVTLALVRLPKQFGKAMQKTTQSVAESVLPVVTRHKKISKKKKLLISEKIIRFIKLLLAILPTVIFLAPLPIETSLRFETAIFIAAVLAIISIIWFSLQYISAKLLRIDSKNIY
ncbi:hypothetical protein H6796_02505 [Candidatus Nomurabacteria bacterium]|nr:hypothetical protein [Candidatus Nomurabacteria bacterium]